MVTDNPATPTLEAVAALAGVSRSTASRVVNASPNVAREAIAAVNDAIDRLGYVPNRAARSLASRRTNTIALVVPENPASRFSDVQFAAVVQGVASYLAGTDFTLTVFVDSGHDPERTSRYLRGGNVDGALILSHHGDDRAFPGLPGSMPIVVDDVTDRTATATLGVVSAEALVRLLRGEELSR